MEKLEKELRKEIKLITEEQDSVYRIIFTEENEYWLAIVVEDDDYQCLLKWELDNIIDKGGYDAVVKTGDYVDFSGEDYEDLDTSVLNYKVVYVYSNDFWKKRELYR